MDRRVCYVTNWAQARRVAARGSGARLARRALAMPPTNHLARRPPPRAAAAPPRPSGHSGCRAVRGARRGQQDAPPSRSRGLRAPPAATCSLLHRRSIAPAALGTPPASGSPRTCPRTCAPTSITRSCTCAKASSGARCWVGRFQRLRQLTDELSAPPALQPPPQQHTNVISDLSYKLTEFDDRRLMRQARRLRKKNPDLKLLVSLGGWCALRAVCGWGWCGGGKGGRERREEHALASQRACAP